MDESRFLLASIPESAFFLVIERLTDKRDFTRLALDVILTHKLSGPGQKGCFKVPTDARPLAKLPPRLTGIPPHFADDDFRGWIISGGAPPS